MSENMGEELDVKICLQKCLNTAYNHTQACMGSKEIVKALLREQELKLVILTKDLTQRYQDVIIGLCQKRNVPIMFLETRKDLAEVFPVKVKQAAAIAIRNFVHETQEKEFLMAALK